MLRRVFIWSTINQDRREMILIKRVFLPMKKIHLLKLALITLTAVSLVVSFIAIYDDDEPAANILCDNHEFFSYYADSLLNPVSGKGVFHEYSEESTYPDTLISYLASKEKSPPSIIPNTDSFAV